MTIIPAAHITNVSVRCQADDLVTRVRVLFDYDHARRDHRQAVELIAREAEARHGRKDATVDAAALSEARSAVALGERWLSYYSRPRWQGELTLPSHYATLLPGDEISSTHVRLPAVFVWLVTDVIAPPEGETLRLSIEGAPGVNSAVALLRQAAQFAPALLETATVVTQDDVAEFTIQDETGAPLVGAKVTVDQERVFYTDANGQVQVSPITPGPHSAVVELEGREPQFFGWTQP